MARERTILVGAEDGKVTITILEGDQAGRAMSGAPLDPQELRDGGISLDPVDALEVVQLIRQAAEHCGLMTA